ncbi:MAG: universal stress protein [Desulfovibrionaceae bacterium]|nr:universal stress protein [Desulfovibrionaceae bacterium]
MRTIQKILCPVDLSEQSAAVAEYAKTLATPLNAKVYVLYCVPSMSQYEGFKVLSITIDSFVGNIVKAAEAAMDEFVTHTFAGIDAEGIVIVSDPFEGIRKITEEKNIDLIVMGTHGRQGVDRMLFGSVAENVVKHAGVPVLTIRP